MYKFLGNNCCFSCEEANTQDSDSKLQIATTFEVVYNLLEVATLFML